jgi:hypothetical protein
VFHYLVFKQTKKYFYFIWQQCLTFVLYVRNTYTMTENELTQKEINTLRAKLFNKAEHILRELYREDFQVIYAELCKEAGITSPRNDKDAVRARYSQLIQTMKQQEN